MSELVSLQQSIQKNCDLIDARFAQKFILCTYLLKMREYYRWAKKIPFSTSLPKDKLMEWVLKQELYWEDIESHEQERVAIGSQEFDPLQTDIINRHLKDKNLVYGGGYGYANVPVYFLGRLKKREEREGYTLTITSQEFARGMIALPGALQGNHIIIRREALRSLLWSRVEEWQFQKRDNPMGQAISFYDFQNNPDRAIEAMTDQEMESVIQHEIGEGRAGERLGDVWNEMLFNHPHTKLAVFARAVRDCFADCMTTLPYLLGEKKESSIHFFIANLSGMRQEISPALKRAYKEWEKDKDYSRLRDITEQGKTHWQETAGKIIDLYQNNGESSVSVIESMIETTRL